MREASEPVEAARAACDALGLAGPLTRFSAGSVPVFAVGETHVVKLFPSRERAFFDAERAALDHLGGGFTSLPTPQLVAAGEAHGWLHVVMSRLPGISLRDAWPSLDRASRARLMREVGAATAELHASAAPTSPALAVDWPRFVEEQRASARARQLAKGLGAPWLDQIDAFLVTWTPRDDGRRALLHTEIMREHLLVEERGGRWSLTGLVDFEPAMVGAPAYDLASMGVFVACAEPQMLAELLAGYGARAARDLAPQIMAYALLHRYSNLRWYLERLRVPDDVRDLETLAMRWFDAGA